MAAGPKDRWDKADIISRWVTGLVGGALLLLLSYCVNESSQRIANAQKNASLVADLIKDLSDTTRVRKELALIALEYAVPKEDAASRGSDLVANVCEHMLLIDTLRDQGNFTLELLRTRDSMRARAVDSIKKHLGDSLAQTLPASRSTSDSGHMVRAIPAVVQNLSKGVVYIQFYGVGKKEQRDRRIMERLRQTLNSRGFIAPGVDSVSKTEGNSVRFFHDGDRATGDAVAATITELLPQVERVPVIRAKYTGSQGLIEVWLDLSRLPDSALLAPL